MISEDTGRGFATGSVSFNQDGTLDLKEAASHLCTSCLNRTMEENWSDNPCGVGVINFKTREIRLFEETVTAFTFGDFYISCDMREPPAGTSEREMDFLIFYCPERYEE